MEKINQEDIISIKNINKKFNDKIVFKDFQIDFYKNQINCRAGVKYFYFTHPRPHSSYPSY